MEKEYLEEEDLKDLPKAKDNIKCPNCELSQYHSEQVLGMTKPEPYVDEPGFEWLEKYKCISCETIYVIENGT